MDFAAPEEGIGPVLSPLGKRLEVLRISRGISKQHLARYAGTSRQQLWRVMTGKSELTGSLRERLASVLQVEVASLGDSYTPLSRAADPSPNEPLLAAQDAPDLAGYLAQPRRVESTLRSLPMGEPGRRLKRALLNELEELAASHRIELTHELFELRRRVLAGEL